eukprot:Hpha_TRINITY_DN2439_c0_g1::TRINITY_DN2439_c0_g1_i1::g.24557::m.24557
MVAEHAHLAAGIHDNGAADSLLADERRRAFLGEACGELSSFCFFVQYLPQMYRNCQRKSTSGFSTLSVWIKLVGASFLLANSSLSGEQLFVLVYCIISVLQYNVLIVQAAMWTVSRGVLLTLLTPIPAFAISYALPGLRDYTNGIKPLTQVASQIALIHCCHSAGTVSGVSMLSMHFNFLGGIAGCAACALVEIKSHWVVYVYINSSLQAASTYIQAWYLAGRGGSGAASVDSPAKEAQAEERARSDGEAGVPSRRRSAMPPPPPPPPQSGAQARRGFTNT